MRLNWSLLMVWLSACVAPPNAALQVSSESVDFGTLAQCRRETRTLELSNVGTAPLTLDVPAVEDFEISPTGELIIAPGETVSLSISVVAPDQQATLERTLVLADREVSLRAMTLPESRLTASILFGLVTIGATERQSFTVSPAGQFDAIDDAAFSITKTDTTAVVRFTPTEARAYDAPVVYRAENQCPQLIRLRGTGLETQLSWSPSAVLLEGTLGRTTRSTVSFRNEFTKPVQLTNLAFIFSFGIDTTLSTASTLEVPAATRDAEGALLPGVAELEIAFTPNQLGERGSALRADTNLAAQPTLGISVRTTTSQ